MRIPKIPYLLRGLKSALFVPIATALLAAPAVVFGAEPIDVDVCVYGATPSGINAAVAAQQEGASVVVIEPSRWLGGIVGAGIKPAQDGPEPRAVGGLTKDKMYKLGRNPRIIRENYEKWAKAENLNIIREHRVKSVTKDGARITEITLENAVPDKDGIPAPAAVPGSPERKVRAKVFIDASYEGDLMARSGVSYSVGRESKDTYGEAPAGVGPATNWTPVSPYVKAGDASSGLLPLVDPDHGKKLGEGDDYTQAYNYRFYVTKDPAKRIELGVPADYDPAQYELVGRYVEHLTKTLGSDEEKLGRALRYIFPGWRNVGEYNYHRQSLVTIAPLNISRDYQDGDYATRSAVWRQYRDYLAGLHHFLSTDARVPEWFRKETAELGFWKEMHEDTNGWPNQLYVRITRRMDGQYRLTHADVLNKTDEKDAVGLGLYGVDTYPPRRYAAKHPETGELGVATEGNMFLGGHRGETGVPYPIPYRSITPKPEEASNLLVPICFSASYIAYASARMEPIFAVLGESAGVAAAQAIRESDAKVQAVDVPALQKRLKERGQILSWEH